jgi:hypothetical protein
MNVEDDGKAQVEVFEGVASASLLDEEGSSLRSQLVEKRKAYDLDPRTGRIAETVAQPGNFVPAPTLTTSSLVLDPGYAGAVLKTRPRGYWRFESLSDEAVPNEIPGSPPLRVSGPVGIDGGPEGNGYASFKDGSPEQYMATDDVWVLRRDPGHAVEFWFQAENFSYTSLVGLFPPREQNLPDQRHRFLHTFLVEVTAQKRQTLHRPASVRFVHRWPLDVKVEYNAYSEDPYVPLRWHHVVAQKNGDRMELYLDGVPARVLPLESDYPTLSCNLVVGRRTPESENPKDSRSFVGRLDELAIYDHPLSAGEVLGHFRLATQKGLPD